MSGLGENMLRVQTEESFRSSMQQQTTKKRHIDPIAEWYLVLIMKLIRLRNT